MIQFTENSEFEELVSEGLILVDFYATWCGPCKMIAPILEELSIERSDIKFVKIDVDSFRELAGKYAVRLVPTLLLFRDGILLDSISKVLPKASIIEWINEKSL